MGELAQRRRRRGTKRHGVDRPGRGQPGGEQHQEQRAHAKDGAQGWRSQHLRRRAGGHRLARLALAADLIEADGRHRTQDGEAGNQREDERQNLLRTLLDTEWNVSAAARKLEWSRMTIYRKLAKYNIRPERSTMPRAKIAS